MLFKLIDTDDNLSVQVHPNNEQAKRYENQNGKTEAWYILNADRDAYIYLGFNQDLSKNQVRQYIKNNTIEKYLNKINVKNGDYYYIESNTIHAMSKGVTVAEIQQSSSITYRLFDYFRKDKFGNYRELHLEKGVDCLNVSKADVQDYFHKTQINADNQLNLIQKSRYFNVFNAEVNNKMEIKTNDYMLITVLNWQGVIEYKNGSFAVIKGDSIFVPAKFDIYLKGNFTVMCNTPD